MPARERPPSHARSPLSRTVQEKTHSNLDGATCCRKETKSCHESDRGGYRGVCFPRDCEVHEIEPADILCRERKIYPRNMISNF